MTCQEDEEVDFFGRLANRCCQARILRFGEAPVLTRVLFPICLFVSVLFPAIYSSGQSEIASTQVEKTGDRSRQLESWLRQRGLERLLTIHFEEELLRESDPSRRTAIARELAELYGRLLNQRTDDAGSLIAGWDRLVANYPEAVDLEASIQIEYGQFRLAQMAFSRWKRTGGEETRHSIRENFSAIAARVQELLARESESVLKTAPDDNRDTKTESDNGLVLNDSAEARDPNANSLQADTPPAWTRTGSRLAYLFAWSQLNKALLSPEPAVETELLSSARKVFRDLLRIPAGTGLSELRPQWFPLESEWNCRILIGLGTACEASGDADDARYCFTLLDEVRAPSSIRSYRLVYQMQAMTDCGRIALAAKWLENVASAGPDSGTGTELWRAAAMYGLGPRLFPDSTPHYEALTLTALRELVVLNDWSSIDDLLDGSLAPDFIPANEDDFFVQWLEGYRMLRAAEKNHGHGAAESAGRFRSALALAERTVAGVAGGRQFELRARCRLHLGVALYLSGQYHLAADELEQAAGVLEHSDHGAAEQALWIKCQSLQRLSGDDEMAAGALKRSLADFQARFPGSERLVDVIFMQTLADVREQKPLDAIQKLDSIEHSHPRYLSAQLEKCRLAHEHWNRLQTTEHRDEAATGFLREAILQSAAEVFSPDNLPPAGPEPKVLVSLLVADCLLATNPPDTAGAESWLQRASGSVDPIQMEGQHQAEWYYLSLRVATLENDRERMASSARWLADHSPDPAKQRYGWYMLARIAEENLTQDLPGLKESQLSERRTEIIKLFERAVAARPILQESTSLLALERLATLQHESGQSELALQSWQSLVALDARRASWWTGLARSANAIGNRDKALEAWNRVASLHSPGNNEWLEARFEMCRILWETDPEAAARFIKQTLLLVPEMPEPWHSRFRELTR